ncbi:MAG: hypothetical protein AAF652_11135 [Cyanobacteria bacterium P01_C01_bin.72]
MWDSNLSSSQTTIGQTPGSYLDKEKAAGKPIRLIRMRVAAKAVRLLFKEFSQRKILGYPQEGTISIVGKQLLDGSHT